MGFGRSPPRRDGLRRGRRRRSRRGVAASIWTSSGAPGSARASLGGRQELDGGSRKLFASALVAGTSRRRRSRPVRREPPLRSARRSRSDRREPGRRPWPGKATTGRGLAITSPAYTPAACIRSSAQVPGRPWNSPGGDDRVLRAALLRPASLPRALADRARRAAERVELPGRGAAARLPRELGRPARHRRPLDPGAGHVALDHRRHRAPLGRARLLQRPRVGVQHRLRAAEPLLRPPEAPRARRSWPASLAVLFVALVVGSVGVELIHRTQASPAASSPTSTRSPSRPRSSSGSSGALYNLLTNAALTWRETLPGRGLRDGAPPGQLPAAARVSSA